MHYSKQKIISTIFFGLFVLGLTLSTKYVLDHQSKEQMEAFERVEIPFAANLLEVSPNDPLSPKQDHVFIPSLGLNAPILSPQKNNRELIGELMNEGVVHDIMSAPFGFEGNSVLFGHSSSGVVSDYDDIFAPLAHLQQNDEIEIFSEGIKYVYRVKDRLVVDPTDNWITEHKEDKSWLTVYTCFPPGSDKDRLTIKAELVAEGEVV